MDDGLLTNRELASLLWLAIGLVWLLLRHPRSLARATRELPRLLRPVVAVFLLYVLWMSGVAWVASLLGWWDSSLLKDVIVWIALSGLGLLLRSTESLTKTGWFRNALAAAVGATALVEFFANARSFPLVVEFLLQPVIFFAMVVPLVAREPGQARVRSCAQSTLGVIGLAALAWVLVGLVDRWRELAIDEVARQIAVPVWLTVGAIGFLYPFSLYMAYENLFARMRARARERSLWRQRLAVISYAGPRMSVLRDLRSGRDYAVVHAPGFRAAWRAIRSVRKERAAERLAERLAAQRLIDNAGLQGRDEAGMQLDQREFAATRDALRWLATCQMGQHRNQGGRYRRDLLDVIGSSFDRHGLPAQHGIEMMVSADGQSWRAHRRTVTGWCFAIGAAGPPPDQWMFDGAEPPTEFPSEASWSRFGEGDQAKNW